MSHPAFPGTYFVASFPSVSVWYWVLSLNWPVPMSRLRRTEVKPCPLVCSEIRVCTDVGRGVGWGGVIQNSSRALGGTQYSLKWTFHISTPLHFPATLLSSFKNQLKCFIFGKPSPPLWAYWSLETLRRGFVSYLICKFSIPSYFINGAGIQSRSELIYIIYIENFCARRIQRTQDMIHSLVQ